MTRKKNKKKKKAGAAALSAKLTPQHLSQADEDPADFAIYFVVVALLCGIGAAYWGNQKVSVNEAST